MSKVHKDLTEKEEADLRMARIVYLAFFIGAFIPFIPNIVGVAIAYSFDIETSDWLHSHFKYQKKVFWYGFIMYCVCIILMLVFIGIFLYFLLLLWWLIKVIRGYNLLEQGMAIPKDQL